MRTLVERVRSVVDDGLVENAEAWSVKAGMSLGYISNFYARAAVNPGADMTRATMQKLADAAGISLSWLAHGRGPRLATETAIDTSVDPRSEGERLFLLRVPARQLAEAEEWLTDERRTPQRRSEAWHELDWHDHYLERWNARSAREVGVMPAASVDESARDAAREAATQKRRGSR